MSGVGRVLEATRAQGRAALIGYLPVGYPDHPTSLSALAAMVEGGVDIVEVGVPYSDPLMDGPLIQRAVDAALRGGARTRDAFAGAAAVVAAGAPAVLMTYWNLVDRFGVERFADQLVASGADGLITPDLIPDEAADWIAASDARGLDRVFLVAPSSTPQRLVSTAAASRGFVYVASTMGVTGVRSDVGSAAGALVERCRAVTDLPLCVGLGVSTRQQAAEVATYADGVIVGSAFVRALDDGGVDGVRALAGELAQGVRDGVRA